MKCRLKDIANELNLSVNTVSNALKKTGRISEETIKLVNDKAQELGYIPNIGAQSLRSNSTKTIAIVYDNFINPYYSILTDLLYNKLMKRGYTTIIYIDTSHEAILTINTAKQIISRRIDGIISFLEIREDVRDLLRKYNTQILVLGRDTSKINVDCIISDDEMGGYLATKHLIDLGHKDILYFAIAEGVNCSSEREKGYKRALTEANIEYKKSNVLNIFKCGWNGAQLAEYAIKNKLNFTAIFCFNDLMALESIYKLNELGYNVPQDISIVGFDNLQSHLLSSFPLTTIDTDKNQLADIGSEVMMLKIENEDLAKKRFTKIHNVTLVSRASATKRLEKD